jgi:streptogramin lyase
MGGRRRVAFVGVAVVAIATAACGTPDELADAGPSDDAGHDAAGPVELRAEAGPSRYALVGEEVVLDGSASVGAVRYQWAPGGGLPAGEPGSDPVLRVRYPRPGRFAAVLTVWDAEGRRRSDSAVISVTYRPIHQPRQSSSIAIVDDHRLAVVSPDSDELALARWTDAGTLAIERRIEVCDEPRTLAPFADVRGAPRIAVACPDGGVVAVVDPATGSVETMVMPYGSRPFGVVARDGGSIFVSLQAIGEVAEITPTREVRRHRAIPDARAVALLPDGRVAVTRWRSPDARGEIAALDPETGALETWTLAYDPQTASDTEIGGVPSYLEQILISPDGRVAVVPSLQAAIGEGRYVTGGERALTFETTVRAIISFLDPATGQEDFERRHQFDNRGIANAGVFSARGDWLFVATRGTRSVERIDMLSGQGSGTLQNVGFAPNGVALSPDDRFLFVDAYLSREIVMYDVRDFADEPAPLARAPIPTREPLDPEILRGKQLFHDALDPRLSRDGYIACANCHLDGFADGRTWDFTDRGEGLRNTTNLRGFPSTGGAIHWTANFDEVQDFEHDIRFAFRGTGLMSDADFHTGTRDQPLGDPKAGVSADLDALAAYVQSLDRFPPSPFRAPDGSLPEAARRGRAIFESDEVGCTRCHAGSMLTDSGFDAPGTPRLHDVGTAGPGSGTRLGGMPLVGFDTPTLHGVWSSAPYLHDGSAATLREVLTVRNPEDRHGRTSTLTAAQIDDLVAYLLCLDGRVD